MTEGEVSEPFVAEEVLSKDTDDASVLERYLEGGLRTGDLDPGQVRRLKDVGYLTSTVDYPTGREYLKTTPSGQYELMLSKAISGEPEDRAREAMRKVLGGA